MNVFLASVVSADEAIVHLRADARRRIYECDDGSYAIDHQGGVIGRDVIDALEAMGRIVRAWPDQPDLNAWTLPKSTP